MIADILRQAEPANSLWTIAAVATEPETVLVPFDDQSNMKVKTPTPATIPPGLKVESVYQAKTEFRILVTTTSIVHRLGLHGRVIHFDTDVKMKPYYEYVGILCSAEEIIKRFT